MNANVNLSDALLGLSGVDRQTLALAPRERNKFVGLGGALLMTAAMAFVSMTFALRTTMHVPWVAAIPFGAMWALGILNIDRWVVAATKRQPRW